MTRDAAEREAPEVVHNAGSVAISRDLYRSILGLDLPPDTSGTRTRPLRGQAGGVADEGVGPTADPAPFVGIEGDKCHHGLSAAGCVDLNHSGAVRPFPLGSAMGHGDAQPTSGVAEDIRMRGVGELDCGGDGVLGRTRDLTAKLGRLQRLRLSLRRGASQPRHADNGGGTDSVQPARSERNVRGVVSE